MSDQAFTEAEPTFATLGDGKSQKDVSISQALDQLKEASAGVCEAFGSLGNASAHTAKLQLNEGKQKALEASEKAETLMHDRPLATAAVAFTAGWLLSRLLQSSGK